MKVQRCKGFRDLSIDEMKRFRLIEENFRNICLNWGYDEVRTPTLEYMHLFTSTGTFTPNLLNKVYSFLDWDGWSGERVVLRPDGTIPIARLYVESLNDKELAKLFYVTNIFIFEETGKETRERWQGGVELIGTDLPLSDVELVSMAVETLRSLRIDNIEIKLSHAGIIKALLAELGMSREEQTNVFDKILDGDISTLAGIPQEKSTVGKTIAALLKVKGKSTGALKNIAALYGKDFPSLSVPLQNFISIAELLDKADIHFVIDIDTGRGFEYYTGIIFHIFSNGIAVGGGGRYNALIPFLGGRNLPASGFALYFNTLMEMIEQIPSGAAGSEKVLVRPADNRPETINTSLSLLSVMHNAGIRAEMELKRDMYAGYNWMVGVKAGEFMVDLSNGKKQKNVRSADEVVKLIKNERTDKDSAAKRPNSR